MTNIKYTTDGRKVIVVGALNSQETIVQEIFITNGCEIPSGENFVVKSLHDAPAVSWKEKNLKELEAKYDSEAKNWSWKINNLRASQAKLDKTLSAMIGNSKKWTTLMESEPFKTLLAFIAGEIKYFVEIGWSTYSIVSIEDSLMVDDDCDRSSLKLVTLFGRDGDFQWNINRYSDGSGSNKKILPCRTYEEAVSCIDEEIRIYCESHSANEPMIAAKEKYGLSNPTTEQESAFYNAKIELNKTALKKMADEKKKTENEIKALELKVSA